MGENHRFGGGENLSSKVGKRWENLFCGKVWINNGKNSYFFGVSNFLLYTVFLGRSGRCINEHMGKTRKSMVWGRNGDPIGSEVGKMWKNPTPGKVSKKPKEIRNRAFCSIFLAQNMIFRPKYLPKNLENLNSKFGSKIRISRFLDMHYGRKIMFWAKKSNKTLC